MWNELSAPFDLSQSCDMAVEVGVTIDVTIGNVDRQRTTREKA
jgi:hypothetical protein